MEKVKKRQKDYYYLTKEKLVHKFIFTDCQTFFGKWCKPNYNSVVATFCYNISRNLPIKINDSSTKLNLVYIDDVIESFCKILDKKYTNKKFFKVYPIYKTTVGKLVEYIKNFKNIEKLSLLIK